MNRENLDLQEMVDLLEDYDSFMEGSESKWKCEEFWHELRSRIDYIEELGWSVGELRTEVDRWTNIGGVV